MTIRNRNTKREANPNTKKEIAGQARNDDDGWDWIQKERQPRRIAFPFSSVGL